MAEELRDLRIKITVETDVAIEAAHRITGREKSEIAREWLHKIAAEEIHKASVMHRLLVAEGIPGLVEGSQGELRAGRGASRR